MMDIRVSTVAPPSPRGMYHTIGAFSGFSSFGVYRFPTYQKLIDFHDPTGVTGWLWLRVKRRSKRTKKRKRSKA